MVILGESGTGKSTSMRNLDPKETFVVNVLNKPLPFKGYKKLYNQENLNFIESDNYNKIISYMTAVNERRPEIKSIIIDDFTFLMNNEYMRRCREKAFDKFVDMGVNMFAIMDVANSFREDLFCFFMCHTEQDHAGLIKPRTVGKMTADYVGIAERVSVVLHTHVIDRQYKFLTQLDGGCLAKSPMGMFEDLYIENDLLLIREKMFNYYEEE